MKDPFRLEQAVNLVWKNLDEADSSELKIALRQILVLASNRARAVATKKKSGRLGAEEELATFGQDFVRHMTDAFSNCLIYGTLISRAKAISAFDAETGRELKSLCRSIAAEISRSLKHSQSCLLDASKLLGLTRKEKADIEYLYSSGACFQMDLPKDSHGSEKRDYAPGSISILVLALCTVLMQKAAKKK